MEVVGEATVIDAVFELVGDIGVMKGEAVVMEGEAVVVPFLGLTKAMSMFDMLLAYPGKLGIF